MFEDDIAALKKFNRLLQSTENVYLDILSEVLPFVVSSFPGGEMALKVYKSLSKLQNSQIKAFLLETGNQDVRTAMKIITNDLDEKNLVYELIQALTLLKRGRDTFLHLIDQEYKKWDWLRETLENQAHPRENTRVNAGADWVHGRQAAWIWRLRTVHRQEAHQAGAIPGRDGEGGAVESAA
jgi:hypothetical protein